MTAISRSPSAGAHVHGYAKSVKGETPAEGFEALFAAMAGGALAPPPVPAANGNEGESSKGEEKDAPQTFAVAPSPTFAPVESTSVESHAATPPLESRMAASSHAMKPSLPPIESHDGASERPKASAEAQAQAAVRSKDVFSAHALAQAALVDIVRSPGRPRTPSANDPETEVQPPVALTAAEHARSSKTASSAASAARATNQPVAEQTAIIDVVSPAAGKPTVASRAAADIARQRQFALSSRETPLPTVIDPPESGGAAFETQIALRKADGALDGIAPSGAEHESLSPAPSGGWLTNLPASASSAMAAAPAATAPRTFDQAAWSAALAQQVAASAIAATRETTVRIEPEGLGPIEVRVSIHTERVDVRFAIEHPVTVNMVRAALPDLERLLTQSGLQLGDAQVAQQNAGYREQTTRSSAPGSHARDDDSAIATPITETRPRVRAGVVDDFV